MTASPQYSPTFFLKRRQAKKICPALYEILKESKVKKIELEPRNHSRAYSKVLNQLFHLNFSREEVKDKVVQQFLQTV